jgi:hypothetical protein
MKVCLRFVELVVSALRLFQEGMARDVAEQIRDHESKPRTMDTTLVALSVQLAEGPRGYISSPYQLEARSSGPWPHYHKIRFHS